MNKYEVIIYWSEEDETFVAEVPPTPRLRRPRLQPGGGSRQRTGSYSSLVGQGEGVRRSDS
jgi:hypothetical protein